MLLTKHKVLITGGSVGIGFALARALHLRDNEITICARRPDPLGTAASHLNGVHAVLADVSVEDDLRRLVTAANDAMGGISLLINNAGLQWNDRYGQTAQDTVLDHVDSEIGTNLTGLVKLTALALPFLRRWEAAGIVNVSSVLAIAPKASAPVYCATKAAVHFFTMSLRYQLAKSAPNIRVYEVLPPGVDTAMTAGRRFRKMTADAVAKSVLRGIETERFEIHPGHARKVAWLHSVSPRLAYRSLRNR